MLELKHSHDLEGVLGDRGPNPESRDHWELVTYP